MTEDTEEINRILKTKDLYEILKVDKSCSSDDLKRAYRKLAVKVHPDRCKDPKATEAFQKVSHAYQTLSDENKRKNYDTYGSDGPQPQFNQGYNANQRYYYRQEMDAEELFRAFFGNDAFGFGSPFGYTRYYYQGNGQQQQQRYRQRQREPPSKTNLFFTVLPMLLLIALLMFSNFLTPSAESRFKSDLQRVIRFRQENEYGEPIDDVDEKVYYVYKSFKYKRSCYIPKVWRNNYLNYYHRSQSLQFYDMLYRVSDDIYAEAIKAQCKLEKRTQGARPACVEMQRHDIHM